jgi:hypothetical protein
VHRDANKSSAGRKVCLPPAGETPALQMINLQKWDVPVKHSGERVFWVDDDPDENMNSVG